MLLEPDRGRARSLIVNEVEILYPDPERPEFCFALIFAFIVDGIAIRASLWYDYPSNEKYGVESKGKR